MTTLGFEEANEPALEVGVMLEEDYIGPLVDPDVTDFGRKKCSNPAKEFLISFNAAAV